MIFSRAEVIAGSDQASGSPSMIFWNTPSPPMRSVRYWMYISSGHTLCPARESGVMPASEKVSIAVKIGRAHVELQSRGHLVCRLLLEKKKASGGGSTSEAVTAQIPPLS